jgi:predicted dehydrogenase
MLKGAIIGFGEVARNGHWPAYDSNPDIRIVAVVDRTADRRELAAELSPGIATFSRFEDVPDRLSLDFIDICTPPALHADPMLKAIARGCHVVCEKPFLLDPAVLDLVRLQSAEAGVSVLPVHNWKYAPIVEQATTMLRSGGIGPLREVEIEVSRLRAAPTAELDRPNWRRNPAISGGGILMDHGWHAVYLALHWFEQQPTEVQALLHAAVDAPIEDEARLSLVFPAGHATINLTWNGDVRRNRMRLTGAHGTIEIADDTVHLIGVRSESVRFPDRLSAGSHHADWFRAMLPDIVASFANPSLSRPVLEEAAVCLSVIQHAYRSNLSFATHRG